MSIIPATDEMKTINELGDIFFKSGLFSDLRGQAQAIVKILKGRELGLAPIEAMMGLNIIKGRVTLSANLMASIIKKSGKYDYRVKTHSDEECTIAFYQEDKEIGLSTFTLQDARRAGLDGGDNWQKYPKNMLFARALSNGARWFTPDAFGSSAVYTPDEMGATVDEDGVIIDGAFSVAPEVAKETPKPDFKSASLTAAKSQVSPEQIEEFDLLLVEVYGDNAADKKIDMLDSQKVSKASELPPPTMLKILNTLRSMRTEKQSQPQVMAKPRAFSQTGPASIFQLKRMTHMIEDLYPNSAAQKEQELLAEYGLESRLQLSSGHADLIIYKLEIQMKAQKPDLYKRKYAPPKRMTTVEQAQVRAERRRGRKAAAEYLKEIEEEQKANAASAAEEQAPDESKAG